jgi:hypothetical protein
VREDTGHDSGESTQAGESSRPVVAVGVTGHRPGRLESADWQLLRTRVHEVLNTLSHLDRIQHLTLMSPLAEGADQIVAREALKSGFTLECPLPFPRDEYARDFSTDAARAEYFALLSLAATVVELGGSRETPEQADVAYTAVGAFMVSKADVMLAIWDGKRARGDGGTGHVVQMALDAEVPVIWIDATTPHDVSVISPPTSGDNSGCQPLDSLATVMHLVAQTPLT